MSASATATDPMKFVWLRICSVAFQRHGFRFFQFVWVRLDCKLFAWKHANFNSGERTQTKASFPTVCTFWIIYSATQTQFNEDTTTPTRFLIFRFLNARCLIGNQQFAQVAPLPQCLGDMLWSAANHSSMSSIWTVLEDSKDSNWAVQRCPNETLSSNMSPIRKVACAFARSVCIPIWTVRAI